MKFASCFGPGPNVIQGHELIQKCRRFLFSFYMYSKKKLACKYLKNQNLLNF